MSMQDTIKQQQKINRSVYGLLSLLFIIFGMILLALQLQDNESDRRHDLANNYHLAISEKGLALLNTIDKTKLWFMENDIRSPNTIDISKEYLSHSPLRMGFSPHDQINALDHELERLAIEIGKIQKIPA